MSNDTNARIKYYETMEKFRNLETAAQHTTSTSLYIKKGKNETDETRGMKSKHVGEKMGSGDVRRPWERARYNEMHENNSRAFV